MVQHPTSTTIPRVPYILTHWALVARVLFGPIGATTGVRNRKLRVWVATAASWAETSRQSSTSISVSPRCWWKAGIPMVEALALRSKYCARVSPGRANSTTVGEVVGYSLLDVTEVVGATVEPASKVRKSVRPFVRSFQRSFVRSFQRSFGVASVGHRLVEGGFVGRWWWLAFDLCI